MEKGRRNKVLRIKMKPKEALFEMEELERQRDKLLEFVRFKLDEKNVKNLLKLETLPKQNDWVPACPKCDEEVIVTAHCTEHGHMCKWVMKKN